MRRIFSTLFLSLCLYSCSTEPIRLGYTEQTDNNYNDDKNDIQMDEKITVRIGGTSFAATLQVNATAKAFIAMLPLTVTMNEHAGNEKYCNFTGSLPIDPEREGTVRVGDLMLWGDDCLVLFYDTFVHRTITPE